MDHRKQSDLDDVPSIMLSKDDVTSRTTATGGKKQPSGKKNGESFSGTSVLISLVLVILLAAVGFLYYQFYEERQSMRASEEALAQTLALVNQLGSQLSVQDLALSETGGNAEKRLAHLDSEVRKLWSLSNKKNKRNISSNAANLAKQKKSIAWLSKKLKASEGGVKAHAETLGRIESQLKQTGRRLEVLDTLEKKAAQRDKKISAIAASDNASEVVALRGRVEELELSIAAIDAHRAQVNRNLNKIRQELARIGGGQ
ncbi:MAG: hypothetical protein JKY01_07745 [Pseudomonadales bacterium]|nr:hypothetical protein [Pseudomonadales bacterium]